MLDIFENEDLKDVYIANKRLDLDIARLVDIFESEIKMIDISAKFYTESEEPEVVDEAKQNKFVELISKIYKSILDAMSTFFEKISDLFSKKDDETNLSTEDFLKSNTGKIELGYTLKYAQDKASKKIAEGNSIIQKLAKATKVDDSVVEKYVEDSASFLTSMKKTDVVEAGSVIAEYSKYTDTYKEFKDGGIKSVVKNIKDPAGQVNGRKVIIAMGRYFSDMNLIYTQAYSEMNKLKKKTYKNMEKKGIMP